MRLRNQLAFEIYQQTACMTTTSRGKGNILTSLATIFLKFVFQFLKEEKSRASPTVVFEQLYSCSR